MKFEIWAETQLCTHHITTSLSHFLEQQLQHLGMSAVSPGKQHATQEKKRQQQREIRLQQTPEEQDAVREKDRQEHSEARLQQTPEEQDTNREKDRLARATARQNQNKSVGNLHTYSYSYKPLNSPIKSRKCVSFFKTSTQTLTSPF